MNLPVPAGPPPRHHVLSVLVENRAGVLARVAGLFARRGYNIFSLAVAPTDDDRFSRLTVVVDVESAPLEQIVRQLDKLVNVIAISELDPRQSVERELVLLTVRATPADRDRIDQVLEPHPSATARNRSGETDTTTFRRAPLGDRSRCSSPSSV